jgi:glutathione-independent formaldehyde dehydrogenase
VDAFIDCVGFEAKGDGKDDAPASVLNQAMTVTRAAGSIGIPGLYVRSDPGSKDEHAKEGTLSMRFGQGWARAHSFHTGQTPTLKYNRALMQAILWDRLPIAEIVNAKIISLDEAPDAYAQFDQGVPNKFVIDPHAQIPR